jgi:hypothetical protein
MGVNDLLLKSFANTYAYTVRISSCLSNMKINTLFALFGPQMALASRLDDISQGPKWQKSLDF